MDSDEEADKMLVKKAKAAAREEGEQIEDDDAPADPAGAQACRYCAEYAAQDAKVASVVTVVASYSTTGADGPYNRYGAEKSPDEDNFTHLREEKKDEKGEIIYRVIPQESVWRLLEHDATDARGLPGELGAALPRRPKQGSRARARERLARGAQIRTERFRGENPAPKPRDAVLGPVLKIGYASAHYLPESRYFTLPLSAEEEREELGRALLPPGFLAYLDTDGD